MAAHIVQDQPAAYIALPPDDRIRDKLEALAVEVDTAVIKIQKMRDKVFQDQN
jgi:hypothetical protein